jgi:PhnB protein
MKQKSFQVAPTGYSVVCPYLMVESVERQIEFLSHVFDANVTEQLKRADGFIQHAEVSIGDVILMMGKAREEWPATQNANYIFVEKADEVFNKALKHGAKSLLDPDDRFYGYREGGFKDPQGNTWWIAQVLEVLSEEEMQKRMQEKTK